MFIYDTLSKKKKVFRPRDKKQVTMFVCGITPYDSPHIGNIRAFLNYDIIANYLRHKGYKLKYIQNITDIDDKIIARSQEKKLDWEKLGNQYFEELKNILKTLNIKSVDKYIKATDHIPHIIKQIKTLIKKGYAYENNGTVFFDVRKFKDYGKLSGQNLKKLKKAERTEKDTNKKHPYDFALWKAKKLSEPSWDSPFGPGRPGWHIEDTAITEHYFGQQYDIHGGGRDLIFPHHECEIAQQESASGKKPFVKYWMHSGFVNVNGEKMSKSLGNFITVKELLEKTEPDIIRFMMLSVHYRSPIDYTSKLLEQSKSSLEKITDFSDRLKKFKPKINPKKSISCKCKTINAQIKKFFSEMDDDFNTPKALAALFSLINLSNSKMDKNTLSETDKENIISFLKDVENIFGIKILTKKREKISEDITDLLEARKKARKEKNWNESDKIREMLKKRGYLVKDTPQGQKLKKV